MMRAVVPLANSERRSNSNGFVLSFSQRSFSCIDERHLLWLASSCQMQMQAEAARRDLFRYLHMLTGLIVMKQHCKIRYEGIGSGSTWK